MLSQARDFVRRQGVSSLREVALHLDVTEDVAASLLQKWLDKGVVERITALPRCSACDLCSSAARTLYRWSGSKPADAADDGEAGSNVKVPNDCPAAGPPQGQACSSPPSQSSS